MALIYRRVVTQGTERERIMSPAYAATTVGMFALIAFVAFEAMAVATVMPTVAADLDGVGLFAVSFAAPLASGVVGMVAAGMWNDRRGPAIPLIASMVLFSAGLVVCGTAPTMEVLLAGRVLQGLGGGAITVVLYVLVGLVFPPTLQPSVFASFAAAWVLPSLFGPALAAWVAHVAGWRWVFLGTVGLVGLGALLVAPALRRLDPPTGSPGAPRSRLWWALMGGVAVLAVELLGSRVVLAALAFVLVLVSLRRLLPAGTLRGARGLPSVIATRGLLSAAFFCGEAYIVFVLQERWGQGPGRAGLALTVVGLVWAAASQVQGRLGARIGHTTAMRIGTLVVLVGLASLAATVRYDGPALLAGASYAFCGAGMGLAYPRTGVAMLADSTDADRGFNSSALTVADSLGAALALSLSGIAYDVAPDAGVDPFVAVFVLATVMAVLGTITAARTAATRYAVPTSV